MTIKMIVVVMSSLLAIRRPTNRLRACFILNPLLRLLLFVRNTWSVRGVQVQCSVAPPCSRNACV